MIWLCRAADQGYADAQYRLGVLYRHGRTGSVPQDIERAYMWYRLAADNRHIWADAEADELAAQMESEQLASAKTLIAEWEPKQCQLNLLRYYSVEPQRAFQERTTRYEKSGLRVGAEAGDAEFQWQAYKMLGNTPDGYKWLCRAADQGYTAAQMQLGYLYGAGTFGFEQDYTRSYLWYSRAASGELSESIEKEIRSFLKKNADKKIVMKYNRYFKEGYDSYGIDWNKFPQQKDEWFNCCKNNLSRYEIFSLCENLMKTGKYEEASIALNFFIRFRKNYNKKMFNIIGKWFQRYIVNWAHCDWASSDILYFFIKDRVVSFKDLMEWSKASSKWKRRAVPVTLVKLVSKDNYIKEGFSVLERPFLFKYLFLGKL